MDTKKLEGALTPERTEEILEDYGTEPLATRNRLVHHALSRHSVAGVSYVPESIHDLQPHFSIEIKTMGACNQKASGRCWIFAGLNLLREKIAKELDLIIIMMTPTTRTMSYLAFTYSQDGYNQMADAISVVVLLFILVCYIIANRFGADIGKSWG